MTTAAGVRKGVIDTLLLYSKLSHNNKNLAPVYNSEIMLKEIYLNAHDKALLQSECCSGVGHWNIGLLAAKGIDGIFDDDAAVKQYADALHELSGLIRDL